MQGAESVKILLVLESMAVRALDAVEAVVVSHPGSWCSVLNSWFQVSQTLLSRPRVKLPSFLRGLAHIHRNPVA